MESNIQKRLVGAVEEVSFRVGGKAYPVQARIDTGAKMSCIDTRLAAEMGVGLAVAVKKIVSSHGRSTRPVIKAKVVLQGVELESEFTIIDRSHMKFPVLIGRNILEKGFIVDPSRH